MTELEILKRAKTYIDKMANGIDPLSDLPVHENDCINQVRIARCLFYVSSILDRFIQNNGYVSKEKKESFNITPEEIKKYSFETQPIPVSRIADKINELVDLTTMKKLSYKSVTKFLIQSGLLTVKDDIGGKQTKVPTIEGLNIGISREERVGQKGIYYVTVYNNEAQKFILDNIYAIIEINGK